MVIPTPSWITKLHGLSGKISGYPFNLFLKIPKLQSIEAQTQKILTTITLQLFLSLILTFHLYHKLGFCFQPRKSKICDFGIKATVKKNVTGFSPWRGVKSMSLTATGFPEREPEKTVEATVAEEGGEGVGGAAEEGVGERVRGLESMSEEEVVRFFHFRRQRRRALLAERKRKLHGDPSTGKLKIKDQPLSISSKRKRKLFKQWHRGQKEALHNGLVSMEDVQTAVAQGEAKDSRKSSGKIHLKKRLKLKQLKHKGKNKRKFDVPAADISVDVMVE